MPHSLRWPTRPSTANSSWHRRSVSGPELLGLGLGLALAQLAHESLDAAIDAAEAVLVDQILVDGRRVAPQPQPQLRFDERAVRLARGHGLDCHRHSCQSRWPPWGKLLRRADGHLGGVCRGGSREALLVHADRRAGQP
jgi:hypothetical protein